MRSLRESILSNPAWDLPIKESDCLIDGDKYLITMEEARFHMFCSVLLTLEVLTFFDALWGQLL